MAMPTPARASAGASLMPSPTKATLEEPTPPRRHPFRLLRRQHLRVNFRDRQLLRDGLRDRGAVAGQQRDGRDAERAKIGQHLCRFWAERVARAQHAEHHAVARHHQRRAHDQQRGLPGRVELFERGQCFRRKRDALFFDQPPRADDECDSVRGRGHAGAGVRLERLDRRHLQTARAGLAHEEPRERVFAPLFGGRGGREQLLAANITQRNHVAEFELAFGQRAGFVERETGDRREPFERRPTLDEYARARESAERRDHGGRRGEDQRARARDHQHRQRWVRGHLRGGFQCGLGETRCGRARDLIRDVPDKGEKCEA